MSFATFITQFEGQNEHKLAGSKLDAKKVNNTQKDGYVELLEDPLIDTDNKQKNWSSYYYN